MSSEPLRFDERTLFAVLSLLAAVLITHIPVFHFDFVYDDAPFVLYNAFPSRLGNLGALLTGEALRQGTPDAHHPVVVLSAMLDRLAFGLGPDGHHVQSVFWHALNTLLLAWLVYRAFAHRALAWLAGLIFAVVPAHAEAVAIVTHREYLMATACILGAVLALLSERAILAALLIFVGMLTSELALAAVLLWPALQWMRREEDDARQVLRRSLRGGGAMLIGAAVALLLRCIWAQSVTAGLALHELPDLTLHAGGAIRTALLQAMQLVLPVGLGAVHVDAPSPWPLHIEWLAAAAVVAGFIVAVRRGADRVLLGSLVIAAIGWLPLWTPWWFPETWVDRSLYLPSVGFSVFAARLVAAYAWPHRTRFVVLGGLAAWLVVGHIQTQSWFRDDWVIGARARQAAPEAARTWQGLAAMNLRDNRLEEARADLRSGLATNPNDPGLLALDAVAACMERDAGRASTLFDEALANAPPHHPRLLLQRAGCALRLGDFLEAVDFAAEATTQAPWMADPHSVRGLALQALGDLGGAEIALLDSARMAPDRVEFWKMLARLYEERGMIDRAEWARSEGDLPDPTTDAPKWYERLRR